MISRVDSIEMKTGEKNKRTVGLDPSHPVDEIQDASE